MRRIVVVTCILVFSSACDPGWSYHVPDPPAGVNRQSDSYRGISMRTTAGLFTGSLDVDVELTNVGAGPLVVQEDPFRVLDSSHRPLPWYGGQPPAKPCEDRPQKAVTLGSGESCRIRARFLVRPNADVFGRRNADLRTITVIVDGLERGGVRVASSTVLEWD